MSTIEEPTPQSVIDDLTTAEGKPPVIIGGESSDGAQHAIAWGASFAERLGLPVVLAHARSPWLAVGWTLAPFDYEEYEAAVRSEVDGWAQEIQQVEPAIAILEDDPAEALLLLAAKTDPTLVVLGAHPRRQWTPNILGSTTAKVLHGSTCPVAVVPRSAEAPHERGLIVGVDGSQASLAALRWAARMGMLLGGEVYALCAYPLEAYAEKPRLADEESEDPIADTLGALRSVTAQVAGETGCTITSDVVIGHPADQLIDAAGDFDMLVVGKTGHSSFREVPFGSISRACATHSSIPVVVVP